MASLSLKVFLEGNLRNEEKIWVASLARIPNSAIVVRGRSETGKAKVEVGKGAVLNYVGGD